jgi:Flp pilus assembly protein TadG
MECSNRYRKDENGATLVEFSLGFPVFIFTITMAVIIIFYIYKIINLQHIAHMAVRDGVIESHLNDEATPNARITNIITTNPKKFGVTVIAVATCRVVNLPTCVDETIPAGALFMTRTEANQDWFSQMLGLTYVVWVLGVNSNPISIEQTTV